MNPLGTIDDAVRAIVREELRRGFREELRLALQDLQAATPAPKEFLSVLEAADLVDVSETTVREWMAKGLRYYRQGRVLRIRRSELLAFLAVNAPEVEQEVDVEQKAVAFLARARRVAAGENRQGPDLAQWCGVHSRRGRAANFGRTNLQRAPRSLRAAFFDWNAHRRSRRAALANPRQQLKPAREAVGCDIVQPKAKDREVRQDRPPARRTCPPYSRQSARGLEAGGMAEADGTSADGGRSPDLRSRRRPPQGQPRLRHLPERPEAAWAQAAPSP